MFSSNNTFFQSNAVAGTHPYLRICALHSGGFMLESRADIPLKICLFTASAAMALGSALLIYDYWHHLFKEENTKAPNLLRR